MPSEKTPEAKLQHTQEPITDKKINELLADWDCEDLLEGVRLLSEYYPSRSLREGLLLTEIAEFYKKHHKPKNL